MSASRLFWALQDEEIPLTYISERVHVRKRLATGLASLSLQYLVAAGISVASDLGASAALTKQTGTHLVKCAAAPSLPRVFHLFFFIVPLTFFFPRMRVNCNILPASYSFLYLCTWKTCTVLDMYSVAWHSFLNKHVTYSKHYVVIFPSFASLAGVRSGELCENAARYPGEKPLFNAMFLVGISWYYIFTFDTIPIFPPWISTDTNINLISARYRWVILSLFTM